MKAAVACAFALAVGGAGAVEVVGRVEHAPLSEISGLVGSSRGDFYWTHNDSGDSARLFAIGADLTPLRPPYLNLATADWQGHFIDNAWHFDWEDIALADGLLYIADVGNNGNARRDLGVYVVHEPDPLAVPKMRAQKFLPIRYPDQERHPARQWHFDCEAVFVADGRLHFITKHRAPGQIAGWESGAKLYRLDTEHTDRDNVLTLVGQRDDLLLATGADLSPNGDRLAVATYTALWLFDRPDGADWFQGRAWRLDLDRGQAQQLEAIAWESESTLLIANEQRVVLRASTAEFKPLTEP